MKRRAQAGAKRDRALIDLAIDSNLRGCDLVKLRIGDVVSGGRMRLLAMVIQPNTGRPVQFELLEPARSCLREYLDRRGGQWTNSSVKGALTELHT